MKNEQKTIDSASDPFSVYYPLQLEMSDAAMDEFDKNMHHQRLVIVIGAIPKCKIVGIT